MARDKKSKELLYQDPPYTTDSSHDTRYPDEPGVMATVPCFQVTPGVVANIQELVGQPDGRFYIDGHWYPFEIELHGDLSLLQDIASDILAFQRTFIDRLCGIYAETVGEIPEGRIEISFTPVFWKFIQANNGRPSLVRHFVRSRKPKH